MGEVAEAYAATRGRITELVRGLRADQVATTVPACPSWSVKDVVAHLTGVVDDILAGRLDGVATDPWTEAQVAARRPVPIDDIVAEWTEKAPQVEAIVDSFGLAGNQLVFDTVTHEHDIRGALGAAGAQDSEAVHIALDFLAQGVLGAVDGRGLAAPRIETTDGRAWGPEAAAVRLSATPFDFMRSCSGRRSARQIAALDWTGEPGPYIEAFTFGPFTVPEHDVPN